MNEKFKNFLILFIGITVFSTKYLYSANIIDYFIVKIREYNENKDLNDFLMAIKLGKANLVLVLLEKNVDVNFIDERGRTPLMHATLLGNADIVKILLNHNKRQSINKVNLNATDIYGKTAFMLAAWRGHEEIVKIFLEYNDEVDVDKVNIHAVDNNGWTAFMHAICNSQKSVINVMLSPESKRRVNLKH